MSDIKRDRLDIMISILQIAREPARKTHILYRANINYYQLMRYLKMLEGLGMIERKRNSGYIITDKGRMFLSLFSNYEGKIPA